MQIILKRIASNQDGTFGVLVFEGHTPFAVTVEREWADNRPNVSCIPPGKYRCKRVNSPKFGNTFEITGVPGRSHILFHWGTTEDDSLGCVIVAEKFGAYKGKTAVLESRVIPNEGFNELIAKTAHVNEFNLEIINVA